MQKALRGSAQDQSLVRAFEAGIIALLAVVTENEPHETEHLDGIFRRFFAETAVAREIAQILRGNCLDLLVVGECLMITSGPGCSKSTVLLHIA